MTLIAATALTGNDGHSVRILAGDGWELVERGDLGCVQIVAAGENRAAIDSLGRFLAVVPAPVGAVVQDSAGHWLVGLSPRSWLLVCARDGEDGLAQKFLEAFPDGTILAPAFGDHLPWLELSGPGSTALLGRMGFLGLQGRGIPVAGARRQLLGHVPAVIHRLGEDHWRIGVERSRIRHFRDWLESASANRGGWPIS
jgi:heterotetrameric sarcosine oxidase gamma subunit